MENRTLKDPVCGMTVTERSFYHLVHEGQTFYFCGPNCKSRFGGADARHAEARSGDARDAGLLAAGTAADHRSPARKLKRQAVWMLSLAVVALLVFAQQWL